MDKVITYSELEKEALKLFKEKDKHNAEISEAEAFNIFFDNQKKLLKEKGYKIEYDELEGFYPMLKKGNYLSKWMLLEIRSPQVFEVIERKHSFFRGTDEMHRNPKTKEIDLDLFNEVLERNEINKEILKSSSAYKISAARFNRTDVVDMIRSGIITSTPSGLYIRKEERECLM